MDREKIKRIMQQLRELKKIWIILYSCLYVVIILLNSIVILVFAFMSQVRKKIPNYLLFIQALVDICYGIKIAFDVLPSYYPSLGYLAKSLYYNSTKAFLGDMIQYIAIGNLIMTSLERFIALRRPLFHRRYVTRCKIICGTVVLVIVSTIPCSVFVYINHNPIRMEQHYNNAFIGFYIFDNTLIIAGIFMVQSLLFMTYYTIRTSVHKKLAEAKANLDINRRKSRHYANTIMKENKKEARVVRLFITIAFVYFVTFLPTSIFNIVMKSGGNKKVDYVTFVELQIGLFVLHVSPAIFDPLLTLYLKHDYQEPITKIIKRFRKRKRSYMTNEVPHSRFTVVEESTH